MRSLRPLTWILVGLNAFDAVSTLIAVQGGIGREVNPLMRALLEWHPASFMVFKLLFGTALIGLLYWRGQTQVKALTITMAGLTGIYTVLFLQHVRLWVTWFLC